MKEITDCVKQKYGWLAVIRKGSVKDQIPSVFYIEYIIGKRNEGKVNTVGTESDL